MLTIRKVQIEALSQSMLKHFEDRMIRHLRSSFSEKTMGIGDQELRIIIQSGMSRAESYEVTDETDVERFLDCIMRLGDDFGVNPVTAWAGDILERRDLSGTDKMNLIDEYELFESLGD